MKTKNPEDSVQNEQFDPSESGIENNGVEDVKTEEAEEKAVEVEQSEIPPGGTVEVAEAVEAVEAEPLEKLPEVDYSSRKRSELVETLELLIENRPPNEIRDDVEKIKVFFYKKYKSEVESAKNKFLSDGGAPEDFAAPKDELESNMKNLLSKFRGKKAEFSKKFEIEKKENLKRKYEIIDQIKDLVNREESINKTFQEFRTLQNEWYSIGAVPQTTVKNLWETYNYNVEIFYDYIKINKELRDLDFKKNLQIKIKLCEKAEDLLNDTNPVNSFRLLQEYHQQWREIGPVPRESRNEIWERFKETTSQINRRHHEYFEGQKDEQKKNLEAKSKLCEKIEEINSVSIESFKQSETTAKEVIELQRVWRTIGFAPKKHNNEIYQRFRVGCDTFFQNKRKFYAANKEMQIENLQLKTDLCVQAEAMQDSNNWKETTDDFIKLQKKWKETGAVPRKNSDKIWKRFRTACDHFFNKKSEYFSERDSSFEDNLKKKLDIIERLNNFEISDDFNKAFGELKKIQSEWSEIGFVPFKEKDTVATNYRDKLNLLFDKLKIDEEQKAIIKYQNKLENLKETPQALRKLRSEREKFAGRIKQLENDIVLWENNIGFFSKSSNADAMIKEVEDKIENAKNTLQMLQEKVRMIDRSGLDE